MSAGFFGLFETYIGISASTSYNWGSVSTATQGDQRRVEVTAVAPPGYILKIEQVFGIHQISLQFHLA
jgi:hypothetical protein